ncbi:MAG: 2-oxoacid ferredoxin oxidoreductase [Candidatus Nealsonbacteria bacterium]|nr:2-oxoacid ferredoxin oxidoreductase [Candidatus Nealsonbacteria bacterium]
MTECDPKCYLNELKPIWCPGCGDYGFLSALARTFSELKIPNHKLFVATGIGCSSRVVGYLKTYGINGIHGRALPISQGAKLAAESLGLDLTVLAIGGDGDLFSIGTEHLPHAVRRNVDIACIMLDNQVYAMTKGQTSPTTPYKEDILTSHSLNPPVDPLLDMLTFGTGFLAQGLATNVPHLVGILKAAITYKGFSFVNVQSQCVSFQEGDWISHLKQNCCYLKEGEIIELPNGEKWLHDPGNKDLARKLVEVALKERPYYGIIYRAPEREGYLERIRKINQS